MSEVPLYCIGMVREVREEDVSRMQQSLLPCLRRLILILMRVRGPTPNTVRPNTGAISSVR